MLVPTFALERLEQLDAHRLFYRLLQPRPDGRTQLLLSPLGLIQSPERFPRTGTAGLVGRGGEPAETFEQASPPFDPVAQPEPDFPCDRTIDMVSGAGAAF